MLNIVFLPSSEVVFDSLSNLYAEISSLSNILFSLFFYLPKNEPQHDFFDEKTGLIY
jgi:hypothetical protein